MPVFFFQEKLASYLDHCYNIKAGLVLCYGLDYCYIACLPASKKKKWGDRPALKENQEVGTASFTVQILFMHFIYCCCFE